MFSHSQMKSISTFFKSVPQLFTTQRYFKSFYDGAKYGGKENPFKIDNHEFKDGKDWKKHRENDPEHKQFKKVYWYIVGASGFIGGIFGFSRDVKNHRPADESTLSFVLGSCMGVCFGIIHPLILPIALPVTGVLYPLHKISQISYNANHQRKEKERTQENLEHAKETRDILHKYTKYVDEQNFEKKIMTYYDWCQKNGHGNHKFGYYENSRGYY